MDLQLLLKLINTLGQLRQHERWTRSQLETYQAEALGRLRTYAYARSPFYQKLHQGLTDRPLHELPVLTKAMLMEHFDELVTDRTLHLDEIRAYATQGKAGELYRGQYWVKATSGSSGHPGFFSVRPNRMALDHGFLCPQSRMVRDPNQPHPSPADGDDCFDQPMAHVIAGIRPGPELVAALFAAPGQPAAVTDRGPAQ